MRHKLSLFFVAVLMCALACPSESSRAFAGAPDGWASDGAGLSVRTSPAGTFSNAWYLLWRGNVERIGIERVEGGVADSSDVSFKGGGASTFVLAEQESSTVRIHGYYATRSGAVREFELTVSPRGSAEFAPRQEESAPAPDAPFPGFGSDGGEK